MKTIFLIREARVKLLASGDKSMKIVLETANPEDIDKINQILTPKTEIELDLPEN